MQWIDRVGRRLKLRDLHILLAVVQSRSMAKAASELAISQPAVSKAIADMEHALGLRLLDRTRQGIEPTMYGRALIRRGLAVFDELRQGVKELEFLADPTAGELRIGSQESIAAGLLPAIIDRFSRQYPRVALHVAQAVFGTMLYRELRERTVDVVLGRYWLRFQRTIWRSKSSLTIQSLSSPDSRVGGLIAAASNLRTWPTRLGSCRQPMACPGRLPRTSSARAAWTSRDRR